MTGIECLLCLELNKELTNCIKIGSIEWNEQNIKSVLEKHLWPMATLKSKSTWLCVTCWEILHDFHDFYRRIKDAHYCYESMVKTEYDIEIEEFNVNKFVTDDVMRPPDTLLEENDIQMSDYEDVDDDDDDDDDDDGDVHSDHSQDDVAIKYESGQDILKQKTNVTKPETVIFKNTAAGQNVIKINLEDQTAENPLELCSNDSDKTIEQIRKQYLTKYYTFTCNICQDPCKSYSTLQHHFRREHKQEAYMLCCGNKYTNRKSFCNHIETHLDPAIFKCKYCLKVLKNSRNLAHHIARWHEGNIFRCEICERKFLDKSKYNKHKCEHKGKAITDNDDSDNDEEGDDIALAGSCSEINHGENEKITKNTKQSEGLDTSVKDVYGNSVPQKSDFMTYDSDSSLEEYENNKRTTINSKGDNFVNKRFTCDICQEPCESFIGIKQHFAKIHAEQKAYVMCCGEKFKSRNCLSEHLKSHTNPDCFKCKYCTKVLKNKRNLKHHIKRWHEGKTFDCDKCDKQFQYDIEYEEHKLTHFGRGNSPLACDKSEVSCQKDKPGNPMEPEKGNVMSDEIECGTTIINMEENHNIHQNTADSGSITDKIANNETMPTSIYTDRSLKCLASNNKTTPQELIEFDNFLAEHFKFTCNVCEKPDDVYKTFVHLRHHFTAEHNMEGYVLCCGTKFTRRRGLVDHVKSHLDPDFFKCKYCGKVLKDRRGLLNHIAMHEGNISRCDICNKKFFDKDKFETHKSSHVSEENININKSNDNVDDDYDDEDDIPLIHSVVKREPPADSTKDDNEDGESKPKRDFKNNIQRQIEYDEFLAKHFKIICHLCENTCKSFETFAFLRLHFASEHKEEAYLICCGQKYKRRHCLVEHIKTHLNPADFTCKFCSKILKNKRNLVHHIAACHDGKLFRCEICQKKFVEESSYEYHKTTHKPDEKTNFECPECDKTYRIKHRLTHHINICHRQRYARLCDICGVYLRDSNHFAAHMKAKHETTETQSHPCDICGRILAAKASLRLHKKTQHPEDGQFQYTCHICSKPMATKGLLNYHIRMSHKKSHFHKCSICGKAYKGEKELKAHMGTHTGESMYTCNFCPKKFNSTGNRSNHRKKCHPKEWQEWKSKQYIQSDLYVI